MSYPSFWLEDDGWRFVVRNKDRYLFNDIPNESFIEAIQMACEFLNIGQGIADHS